MWPSNKLSKRSNRYFIWKQFRKERSRTSFFKPDLFYTIIKDENGNEIDAWNIANTAILIPLSPLPDGTEPITITIKKENHVSQ